MLINSDDWRRECFSLSMYCAEVASMEALLEDCGKCAVSGVH